MTATTRLANFKRNFVVLRSMVMSYLPIICKNGFDKLTIIGNVTSDFVFNRLFKLNHSETT